MIYSYRLSRIDHHEWNLKNYVLVYLLKGEE